MQLPEKRRLLFWHVKGSMEFGGYKRESGVNTYHNANKWSASNRGECHLKPHHFCLFFFVTFLKPPFLIDANVYIEPMYGLDISPNDCWLPFTLVIEVDEWCMASLADRSLDLLERALNMHVQTARAVDV
jgi:hypothetical protein